MLRLSTMFLRTLREDPADAEVASHRLLVRAGYIRRAAPGGFTCLPLGWIVYQNVERVVREEMDRAGFQEVHFPALLPREPYESAGRWTDYGDNLFRLKDRRGADLLLAPTHEEMFTLLVKDLYSSYKDLPLVHLPDPDEVPRRGPAPCRPVAWPRVRDEGLLQLRPRPRRPRGQLPGATASPTSARSTVWGCPTSSCRRCAGAMGGSASEEFLAPMDVGEDTYVRCTNCDYAANTEAVQVAPPWRSPFDGAPRGVVADTPDTPTIQTLVDLFNARDDLRRPDRDWTAADTLKNLIVKLKHPDGRRRRSPSACPATARST